MFIYHSIQGDQTWYILKNVQLLILNNFNLCIRFALELEYLHTGPKYLCWLLCSVDIFNLLEAQSYLIDHVDLIW